MEKINLTQAIKLKKEKIELEQKKEERETARYEKLVNDFWTEEKKHYKEKLILAEQAFNQLRNFNKKYSSQIRGLLEEDEDIGSIGDGVILLGYNWAHKGDYLPKQAVGRWSTTYAHTDCFLYKTGYKWMGFMETIRITNPHDLASNFTRDYVKKLVQKISSLEEILIKKLTN